MFKIVTKQTHHHPFAVQLAGQVWIIHGENNRLGILENPGGLMRVPARRRQMSAGIPAKADRFTYILLIGLSIILVWGYQSLDTRWGFLGNHSARFGRPVFLSLGFIDILAASAPDDKC